MARYHGVIVYVAVATLCSLLAGVNATAGGRTSTHTSVPGSSPGREAPQSHLRSLENTDCYAEYYCINVSKYGGPEDPIGRMPIRFHGFLMTWHDCWAGITLLLLLHNVLYNGIMWLPCCWRDKGQVTDWFVRHKVLGSLCLKITIPMAIIPALFDCWFWRPFFLVRIIGLYGCSFLACTAEGLVFRWHKHKTITRVMLGYHIVNSVYFLYDYIYIFSHFEAFGGEPLRSDGKVSKLCKEMAFIVLAFALWEPYNAYVLYKHGAGKGSLTNLNLVRHHMLNMLFLLVLAIFGPALFFFHDTAHLWIPENGFPVHGLPWYVRMLGMLFTTVVPILLPWVLYLPRQVKETDKDGTVTKVRKWAWGPYVDHFLAAWNMNNKAKVTPAEAADKSAASAAPEAEVKASPAPDSGVGVGTASSSAPSAP